MGVFSCFDTCRKRPVKKIKIQNIRSKYTTKNPKSSSSSSLSPSHARQVSCSCSFPPSIPIPGRSIIYTTCPRVFPPPQSICSSTYPFAHFPYFYVFTIYSLDASRPSQIIFTLISPVTFVTPKPPHMYSYRILSNLYTPYRIRLSVLICATFVFIINCPKLVLVPQHSCKTSLSPLIARFYHKTLLFPLFPTSSKQICFYLLHISRFPHSLKKCILKFFT